MEGQDKQTAIMARDLFNEQITPLREAYPTIKKIQDVLNRDINRVIYDVPAPPTPHPTKPMLDSDLHYHRLRKIFSVFFLKGGLTLKPDVPGYSDQGFRNVVDCIAGGNFSNVARVIGMANYNKTSWGDEHFAPHPVDKNGIFDLHTINKAWEDQAKWRIEYMVERGLTVRYIFNDQSSVNGWHKHWLNQENNRGWDGPTYDDHHGWFKWVHAETYTPEKCTEERREWYRATGKYIKYMRDYIVKNILMPYKQYIIWDNNEVDAGGTWHGQEADFLNNVPMGKWQRITSVRGVEWFHTRSSIPARWMIEAHGIRNAEEFENYLDFLRSPYIENLYAHEPVNHASIASTVPSTDGLGESWINKVTKKEMVKIYRINQCFQGNSEGRWDSMNPKIYEYGEALRDEVRRRK